jgi:hypothetical protein
MARRCNRRSILQFRGDIAPQTRHSDVRVDTREQFLRAKGLYKIVVGAGVKTLDFCFVARARRQKNNRQVA